MPTRIRRILHPACRPASLLGGLAVLCAIFVGVLGGQAAVAAPGETTSFALPAAGAVTSVIRGGDDAVWFSETSAGRIGRASREGIISEIALPPGSSPGALTRGREGTLWFADETRPVIGRIDRDARVTEIAVPTAGASTTLTLGSDGSLWFGAPGTGTLSRIRPDGTVETVPLPPPLTGATGLTLGPDARPWFSDPGSGSLGVVDADGAVRAVRLESDGEPVRPAQLLTGADGRLWFTDAGGRIGSSDLSGRVRWTDAQSRRISASALTLGPDARVWFADSAGGRIGHVTESGTLALSAPVALRGPVSLAAGADGALWVVDPEAGLLWRLEPPFTAIEAPDPAKDLLLLIGAALIGLAVLIGAIIVVVLLVRSRRPRRSRHDDFFEQLRRAPPAKIEPRAVRGDAWSRWWRSAMTRLFDDAGRDGAVDLSRAAVVVGLIALIVLPRVDVPPSVARLIDPGAMTLLAVGVGMSVQRRCSRAVRFDGVPALQARARLLAQAVLLYLLGSGVQLVGAPHGSVLVTLAGLLLACTLVLHTTVRRLAVLILVSVAAAPAVILGVSVAVDQYPQAASVLEVLSGESPLALLAILIPAVYAGILGERAASGRIRSAGLMMGYGAAACLAGLAVAYGVPALAARIGATLDTWGRPVEYRGPWLPELIGTEQVATSPFLVLALLGGSVALLGLLRLSWSPLRWILFPATALGSLALSIYVMVSAAGPLVPGAVPWLGDPVNALIALAATLGGASLWRLLLPFGPVEWVVDALGRKAAALGRIPPGASRHRRKRQQAAVKRRVRSNWTAEGRRTGTPVVSTRA